MKVSANILLLVLLLPFSVFSQEKTKKLDTVFCDCPKARIVKISGSQKVGETIAPSGPGNIQEITSTKLSAPYAFEKEHHSAWYKLQINAKGSLSFNIIPSNPEDDYDFILFGAGKNNFCDSLSKYKIKPVRANISRVKNELQGKTGLRISAKSEFVKKGVNEAYAHSIVVVPGETYYLVLDNVYPNGGGHIIQFFFEQMVNIKGVVKDDESKPVEAIVTLTDIKGNIVAETKSIGKSGEYEMHTPLKRGVTYSLNYYNDSSFVFSRSLTLKDTLELKDIRTVLPKLKRGRKYSIGTINFHPGSPEYLPQSLPSIENLYKLMNKNATLKVQIIGHTNGPGIGVEELSQERAKAIKYYLERRKISGTRIETLGKGSSEMLFALPCSEEKQEQNRRVEIKVLDF